jgi:tRNA(fMet)-specific endonuclease VapC
MLDTDICIYVMRDRPAEIQQRFDSFADELCISMITLGELLYGAEKSDRRVQNLRAVERFSSRLEVLPFSPAAASHYGQIRAELEQVGTPAGPYDMLIGGHARSEGLTVVTNNVREFFRMPGLRVENWVS